MAVVAAVAVPHTIAIIDRPRAHAAARYLASWMTRARTEALMRSATVALRFEQRDSGVYITEYMDGDRDGVRSRDIADGIDRLMQEPVQISQLFPRVSLALSDDVGGSDPVQTGRTTIMSFTPEGTATSGSIYLRGADGSQFAVRVLGATGRMRVLRYVPESRSWVEVM